MNRKQRKRKEQKARDEKAAQLHPVPIIAQQIGEEHLQTKEADKGTQDARKKGKTKMRLIEWMEHNAVAPNWIIAVFTVVLGAFAITQAVLMDSQLSTMRKDQRPWLRIDIDGFKELKENTTALGTMQVINEGKTPARDVLLEVAVEKLKKTDTPSLDWSAQHSESKGGTVFPNKPHAQPIPYGLTQVVNGRLEFLPITLEDTQEFGRGDIYFAIYAKATYKDFFGIEHWTHFCIWAVNPSHEERDFSSARCTEYNDVDDH